MHFQQALEQPVVYWCFHRGTTVLLSSFISRSDTDVAQKSEFRMQYTEIRMLQLERWLDGAQKSRDGSGLGVQGYLSRSAYGLCYTRPSKSVGTGSETKVRVTRPSNQPADVEAMQVEELRVASGV